MKKLTPAILFIVLFFILLHSGYSQTNQAAIKTGPLSNPLILSHYSVSELEQIRAIDSLKYNKIVYYYTQSFFIEKIPCTECVETDISTFDINKYEKFRENFYCKNT